MPIFYIRIGGTFRNADGLSDSNKGEDIFIMIYQCFLTTWLGERERTLEKAVLFIDESIKH